jgi:hypothetical protein
LMEILTPFPQTPIGSWIRLGFPKLHREISKYGC